MALLRLSPRLSSAKFRNIYDLSPPPTSHLTHSTLHTLAAVGAYCTTLLDALTLPSLVDLDLIFEEVIDPFPTELEVALPAFLKRNNSMLHRLSLSHMSCVNGPALVRIMALAPHLRSLTLSEGPDDSLPFNDAPIRALHPPPPPRLPLCPHLQRLQLSRVRGCPNGVCAAMLRARWGAQAHANKVASLEWVKIDLVDGVHDRDQADMKELYAEGMQGDIIYHRYDLLSRT
ncbi:hypothetical protein BD779DRAFT_1508863 [Infundibulicybe gibba]|nr:hypothetical protein BD779DRAFT_1508863 [Infundibulicybe gibba]